MNILIENLILDAPIVFSAFIFFLNGWNKGVVRPVMNFVSFIGAIILSGFISFSISSFLLNNLLKDVIIEKLSKFCLSSDIHSFPSYIIMVFNFCGINNDSLLKIIKKSNPGNVLFNIIYPFLLNFIRFIIGSSVFGILIGIFRKISKSSCSIFSVPILSQFNSFIGAILGVLKGIFIIWGCILFLKIALIYWNNPPQIFSQDSIQCSSIFVRFYNFNSFTCDLIERIPLLGDMDVSKCLINLN